MKQGSGKFSNPVGNNSAFFSSPRQALIQGTIEEDAVSELDRQEIHEYTDGSDDDFLYARGFLLAAGKDFFEAVNAQPSLAPADVELEEICYLPYFLYQEKFGEMPASEISRESCTNLEYWN